METLNNQGSTLSDSIQNLKIINLINESNYVVNEQFIDGKSNYIKKLEKIFDVEIEPFIIICGIDTSIMKFKNLFDNLLFTWSPTPYECFKNSTSHIVKADMYNCTSLDNIVLLKYGALQRNIHMANGSMFYKIDLLISLSRNGETKQFRVDHPKIVHMFQDGLFLEKNNKYLVNQIKEYLNCAFSSNPVDLINYVTNICTDVNRIDYGKTGFSTNRLNPGSGNSSFKLI